MHTWCFFVLRCLCCSTYGTSRIVTSLAQLAYSIDSSYLNTASEGAQKVLDGGDVMDVVDMKGNWADEGAVRTLDGGAGAGNIDGLEAVGKVEKQAQLFLHMFTIDLFPRFLKSKLMGPVMSHLAGKKADSSESMQMVQDVLPKNEGEWLQMFRAVAETFPACIVISDMQQKSAPMVYVNPEFCRTTRYSYAEAVNRNCEWGSNIYALLSYSL